jgi:hypothetical protein
MFMSKTLVMNFLNEGGKKVSIKVNNVKEDVTEVEAKAAMDAIIAKNIFASSGGDLRSKDSAQLIDKTTSDFEVK